MSETVLTPMRKQSKTKAAALSPGPSDETVAPTTATTTAATVEESSDDYGVIRPDISHISTEDDEPVDNLPSEKHQRLLVEPLYTSTLLRRPFLAAANVGIFGGLRQPPIVPDMFLSLDVQVADDWWAKENRSYFIWEFGKPPDVAIEIVSNRRGGEAVNKSARYAQLRVTYYVIFDPQHLVQPEDLRVYELNGGRYRQRRDCRLLQVGLRLTIWEGIYEDKHDHWLRWCDDEGNLLPTGAELASQAQAQAAVAQQQAAIAQQQAAQERQRAEVFAAKLRELGIDPEQL
jgi:Uma2 family endonuclease